MNLLIRAGKKPELYKAMRAACPVEGEVVKFMTVILDPGESVEPHAHRRHAVLFYPSPAEKVIIHPQAGTMIYLPPGAVHEVPPVIQRRVSIAMLIEEER